MSTTANFSARIYEDESPAEAAAAEVTGIQTYRPFPDEMLPSVLQEFAVANAKAIGCDVVLTALPMLIAMARAIGNRRVVEIKPTWREPSIIWGAIVGYSGDHKTPAMQTVMPFIDRIEGKLAAENQQVMTNYEPLKYRYDLELKKWAKTDNGTPAPLPPKEPMARRFRTMDATVEAIVEILSGEPDGLLVCPDELNGWLGGIAQYKRRKGADMGFWLSSWSGLSHTVDRKTGTRKTLHIPRASVWLVGGVQPDILRQAIGSEHLQDGLCARLLLAWPPAELRRWPASGKLSIKSKTVSDVFDRLLSLEAAIGDDGKPAPVALYLSDVALRLFIDEFNARGAVMQEVPEDLRAALSKLEAYTARLALVFQLCDWATEEPAGQKLINATNMERAIAVARWFEHEAHRVYSLFHENRDDTRTRQLIELIKRREGRITARDLARGCRHYREPGQALEALEQLAREGHGAWIEEGNRDFFVLGG